MYSQKIDNVKTMSKDKLITVRIKPELYDSFKVWTENRNSNISDAIRAFILDCLNGTARQNIDNEDTIKKLESSLYDRLYNQLYKELSSQLIDNVYSRIDNEQVGIDDNVSSQDIDTGIDDNLSSQCIDNDIDSEDYSITMGNEDDDVIEPSPESVAVNGENDGNEGIGTLKDAIDNVILPEKEKGMSDSGIAKLLHGKYISSKNGNSTNWQGNLVKRALEYRDEGKI